MTYSSGMFEGRMDSSLEDAQSLKYERILENLGVRAGDRVLEIGCGWGGFAEHAARTRGCRVHGITLSKEQLAFARDVVLRRRQVPPPLGVCPGDLARSVGHLRLSGWR